MKKIFLICLTLFLPVVTWADDELAPDDMSKQMQKELQSIKINYDGAIDNEDKEALEDMIKIACKKATDAVDKEMESKMGAYGSALNGLF